MNSIDLEGRNRAVGHGCSILDSYREERQLVRRNKHPKTATGRERGECNRSPSRNLEMLRIQSLPSLIGYLIQALCYCDPQFVALTTSIFSAHLSKLQHPSKARSRIDDPLRVESPLSVIPIKLRIAWAFKGSMFSHIGIAQIASVTTHAQHAAKHVSPRCYSGDHMNHNKFVSGSSFETLACTFRR